MTRSSSSTRKATWSGVRCVRATCTAPTGGATSSTGWWRAIAGGPCDACYAAMRPSRCPMCTRTWRRRALGTRSACPPTACSRSGSVTCCGAPSSGHLTAAALLRELPLPGAELEPAAPGGREGGVASRRAVPARRFHRDEPAPPGQEGRRVLQRARDRGAVHQGGQERGQVDSAVVHDLPGQRRAATASRPGLQPGQLPSHARPAGRGRAVVPHAPAGEAGEDRCEGDRPRPLRDLQMAEVAVPRELFGRILERIARLRPPDPAPC
jgi:hypothetical protein